jgi:hypothetical protein
VASVDRAREMGIDWWEHDPTLSSGQRDVLEENRRLRQRIGELQAHPADGEIEPGHTDQAQRPKQSPRPEQSPHEHHQEGSS